MPLCNSINFSDVMESSSESESDSNSVDDLDLVSVFPSPNPAIKELLSLEWVVNLPRCQMMKESLSGM